MYVQVLISSFTMSESSPSFAYLPGPNLVKGADDVPLGECSHNAGVPVLSYSTLAWPQEYFF